MPLPGVGPAAALPLKQWDNFRFLDKRDDRLTGSAFVSEFKNQERAVVRETRDRLETLLNTPMSAEPDANTPKRMVTKIELKNSDRDYFDLKELHDAGVLKIAASDTDVQTIYRMDLNVQATDTNVANATGPRVARNADPIRLRIVSEGDLLTEIGIEEKQLGERLDDALAKLALAKRKYEFVRTTNGYQEESPQQVDAVKVRAQDALQDVERARDVVQAVVREFRRLTRECEINRVNDATQTRSANFTALIESILSEAPQADATFPSTQAQLNGVQNALNARRWAPLAAVSDAENSLYKLERRLKDIRDMLGEAVNKDKLKKALIQIKEHQGRIRKEIKEYQEYIATILNSPHPTIGGSGLVSLGKGETKRVEQKIQWNQYQKDDIIVKVTASDPSITVVPELKLNYETNQFRFDYEIKAGNKEGSFKVILTPAVGPAVEVPVVVK